MPLALRLDFEQYYARFRNRLQASVFALPTEAGADELANVQRRERILLKVEAQRHRSDAVDTHQDAASLQYELPCRGREWLILEQGIAGWSAPYETAVPNAVASIAGRTPAYKPVTATATKTIT